MRKTVSFISIFCLVLSGCQNVKNDQQVKKNRSVLRYPLAASPLTLDPALVQDNHTLDVMQQVYENLVTLSNGTEIRPKLAERWVVSSDGTVYDFYLKKTVKFHNGKHLTADDVKWSLERSANPKLASPVSANYLDDIVGFEDRVAGRSQQVKGVQVLSPYRVRIVLKQKCPYFLGKLTYPVAAVLPKRSGIREDMPITQIEQAIGTGPFSISRFAPNQLVVLNAFSNYHEGAPQIEQIDRPIIKDPVTRLNKYKAGEVDLLQADRRDLYELKKSSHFASHLHYYHRPAIAYLNFNASIFKPFQSPRVRQAFALALDRAQIVDQILGGVHGKCEGIIPWEVLGHRPKLKLSTCNPVSAQQLLREDGYSDSNPFPKLELYVAEDQKDLKIAAEAVVTQLRKNLKISVTLKSLNNQALLEKKNQGVLPFYCSLWIADYLDPHNFLTFLFNSKSHENKTEYKNLEFDSLCNSADAATDSLARIKRFQQAEDLLIKDVAFISLYSQCDVVLVNPKVKGLKLSPFGYLAHSKVEIEH